MLLLSEASCQTAISVRASSTKLPQNSQTFCACTASVKAAASSSSNTTMAGINRYSFFLFLALMAVFAFMFCASLPKPDSPASGQA